jgi:hypothetical protein
MSGSFEPWYSAVTSIVPTMLAFRAGRSSAGIQYSRMVFPPAWRTSYWSRNDRRTWNLVTYPAPERGTFQSRAILAAYSWLSTG